MKKPTYSSRGELDVESFDALSYEELRNWVRERLTGRDSSYAAAPGDMPHYTIAAIFHRLSRLVRRDIENIVIGFLAEISLGHDEWLSPAGEELLLLTDPVLLQTPRLEEVVDILSSIACSLKDKEKPNLCSHRAAQALATIDFYPSPHFWISLFSKQGPPSIPIILEGLARGDLRAALQWVSENNWQGPFAESFLRLLPMLAERHGTALIREELGKAYPRIPGTVRHDLKEFALSEGFEIFPPDDIWGESASIEIAGALTSLLEDYLSGTNTNLGAATTALSALRRLMPRIHQGNLTDQIDNDLWRSYVRCLNISLERRELVQMAYEQLISQLPTAESLEVTRLVLHEEYLSEQECRNTLSFFYDSQDIDSMIGNSYKESKEVDHPYDSLEDSLVAALSGEGSEPIASILRAQDLTVPKNEKAWAQSILAYANKRRSGSQHDQQNWT